MLVVGPLSWQAARGPAPRSEGRSPSCTSRRQDVVEMRAAHSGNVCRRREAGPHGPSAPAAERGVRRTEVGVGPQVPQALLHRPRPSRLEGARPQGDERSPCRRRETDRIPEPGARGPSQGRGAVGGQGAMRPIPHRFHRGIPVRHDMALVEHDRRDGVGHVRPERLAVGLPHVHRDRGGVRTLRHARSGKEGNQADRLPIIGDVQDAGGGGLTEDPASFGVCVHSRGDRAPSRWRVLLAA